MNTRLLSKRNEFATEDILRLIEDNDISNLNTFLVLNGGTGVGKTSSVMRAVQGKLEEKLHSTQSMLVVESRTATVDQLVENYADVIETINGIDTVQRLGFLHLIQKNMADRYDWIVIDECHGLFSEAIFADDAEAIASWIKNERFCAHIIFITANDEYFDELSRQYFPEDFNFIYLFPDFTHYVSNTYVKEIRFIKTTRTKAAIEMMRPRFTTQKGIIFLKKASDVKDWFFELLGEKVNVGMVVSQANQTESNLTVAQEKIAQDALINISEGQAGGTMADLCQLYDTIRIKDGKEGIREAIIKEHLPDDINVLLATDTIQEGISIKSPIQYIVIEGYSEVEVRQKLGRFRGNLELLYIIFNPASAGAQLRSKLQTFEKLRALALDNNQIALAEAYGVQQAAKFKVRFLVKRQDKDGQIYYAVNEPAYLDCKRQFHFYTQLTTDTSAMVEKSYSYPLLNGAPKILNYNDDIRNFNLEEEIRIIARKWVGIPLKGPAQEEIVEDFKKAGITDKTRRPTDTFKKVCNALQTAGIELKTRKANKKDLEQWPQYLTKAREEFKSIMNFD